jgi:hypothetical protein
MREYPPQQRRYPDLEPLAQHARIGQRDLGLKTAMHAVQAPLDEMLAVVAEQTIALLAQS